jgi:hypothetical protein
MDTTENISNSVDKLDFILYEDIFNKYIKNREMLKKFICKLNNTKYTIGSNDISDKSILNSVDNLDFILYEDIFNKYIKQKKNMSIFISKINNYECIFNRKYIDFPDNMLNINDIYLKIVLLQLNKLNYDFNNCKFFNVSDNKDFEYIQNKIKTINSLIKISNIDSNNFHLFIHIIESINTNMNIVINCDENKNLISSILNYNDDNNFIFDIINKNF